MLLRFVKSRIPNVSDFMKIFLPNSEICKISNTDDREYGKKSEIDSKIKAILVRFIFLI